MSSSGQAPNVSMDDLLASIKSMIEGESSGEANSQVGANIEPAPGMTQQGAGVDVAAAPNNALDDGIMDLTQVVSAPQTQQQAQQQPQAGFEQAVSSNPTSDPAQGLGGINPLLQGQAPQEQAADMTAGQSAQDAAAKLDDIFSGMDGDAALNNMSGDIGLPASQAPDTPASLAQADAQHSNPMARGLGEVGVEQTPVQAQMQNDLQGDLEGQPPQGNPLQQDQAPFADQLTGAPEGMDGVSARADQPIVPLDQGKPQFNGGPEGQVPPESGVPHPGFAAEPETPGSDTPGINPAMMNSAQEQQPAGEQPQAGAEQQRAELMGGHDPRLEHDIALGQALSQADASLNLSNPQAADGQTNQPLQQQAQMRGLQQAGQQQVGQQGQMPAQAQMGGQMGHAPQPHPMQAQQGQAGHQGQMVPQAHTPQGHTVQGHMPPQAQMGQHPGQMAPQGYMGAPQMGVPQMGGADMLPVPSGFRPVLPAVHGQGDAPLPGAMGDQLPVEMKNNLEEIVKQLLKPLLRDWLERNLPELLKGVVDEETGKIDPNKW